MKRIFSVLLTIAMLLACMSVPALAEPVVLQFWGAIPPENGPQEVVDIWNAAHPDIQVEYTRFVNDDAGNTKLETALLAGEVDVFINYPAGSLDKRVEAGLMIPLDDYLAKDGIDLVETWGESNHYRNGKCWFVPSNGGNDAYLIYNKDLVEAAGVTIPDRWTWEEFEATVAKLTTGAGPDKIYGLTGGYSVVGDDWAFGAKHEIGNDYMYKSETESNFDHPAFLRDMKVRYQMEVEDETMIPRLEVKMTNLDVPTEFANGKIAMIWGNYHVRDMKNLEKYPHDFKIGFAPVPMNEDQETFYFTGVREWVAISPSCETPDAAWEFVKYFSTEGFYPMCKSGRLPAWRGADSAKAVAYYLGDQAEELFDTESFNKYVMKSPYAASLVNRISVAQSELVNLMGEAREAVMLGEMTPEEAIAQLKIDADAAIANAK